MGQVEDGAVGLGMTTYVSPVQSITPKQKVMHMNPLHTCLHACLARPAMVQGTGHTVQRPWILTTGMQACKRSAMHSSSAPHSNNIARWSVSCLLLVVLNALTSSGNAMRHSMVLRSYAVGLVSYFSEVILAL